MPTATHGCSRSKDHLRVKAYRAWVHMRERCEKPSTPRYERYGGRGVRVCKEWGDFSRFLRDVGLPPSVDHVLDREDNDAGYYPGNVRWVTEAVSLRNKTNPGYPPRKRLAVTRRIRQLVRLGFSTRKIAQKVGISKSYVHRIVSEMFHG